MIDERGMNLCNEFYDPDINLPTQVTCLRGDERVESDDVDAEVEEGVDEDGGGAAAVARRRGAHQQRLEERRVRHADQEDGVQRQRNHRVQLR